MSGAWPKENVFMRLFLLVFERKAELFKLLGRNFRRRIGKQTESAGRLRKRDDFPDGFFSSENHNYPVKAKGYSAVGRSAVVEGFEEKSEFFLCFFLSQAQNFKYFSLKLRVMNTDRAAANLTPLRTRS